MALPRGAAFFDVDETVIRVKSMFDFLRYWMACAGDDGSGYHAVVAEVQALAARDVSRAEINRRYYRQLAGAPMADLMQAGRKWYKNYRDQPTAFVTATCAALNRHRVAGDIIVLVSGSFRAVLKPLADELLADIVLCSEPLIDIDGRLTGEVAHPMIGERKAEAVTKTIKRLGLSADDCFCYGDHASDLDMLSCVGNPVVIGDDPVLTEHARRNGWLVLRASSGPRAVAPLIVR